MQSDRKPGQCWQKNGAAVMGKQHGGASESEKEHYHMMSNSTSGYSTKKKKFKAGS